MDAIAPWVQRFINKKTPSSSSQAQISTMQAKRVIF
jgi:hypothetical protein